MNESENPAIDASERELAEAAALAAFLEGRGEAPDRESERVVALLTAIRERPGAEFARIRGRRFTLETFSRSRRERTVFLRIAASLLAAAVGLTFFLARGRHEAPGEALLAQREASARAAVEALLASRQESFDAGARASGIADSRYQDIYRSVKTERFESLTKERPGGASSYPFRGTAPTRVPS
ncbi:MAG: hypothetical protein IT186_24035 [Acidobacteria bacterium]|nr:hypothetical protein [Acidobacteriota bacterium]MCG3191559.1 hypothetical protein [Thermoanaerobaculia bacterium]MCK6686011.1 hypothetical protein [Thermoanaerobaculia bacterium]